MYNVNVLDNGITVLTESIPFVRSISFGICVKVGSQNENEELNGISHFIEHMTFKGTQKRSAKDIAEEMDAIGGQMNAFTTKQITCYYVKVLDTNFDKALEIMSDMFLNSTFSDDEMAKEKKVIIEEINMYEDTPEELVFEILNKNVFQNSTLAYPILGSSKNVESFTNQTVKTFRQENYVPENIIISVAGNFDTTDMLNKIQNVFGSLEKQIQNKKKQMPTAQYKKSIVYKQKDIEQVHLCLGFEGTKNSLENNYTMALFNTIFGGGMSSRLYQKIREENGLAYSLFSYNYSYENIGLFTIYAAVNPDKVLKCVEIIIDEIKNLDSDLITPAQLSKAKEQIKSTYIMNLENSSSRMNSLAKSFISYGKILSPDQIVETIDRINIEQIYSLIKKIFLMDKLSIAVVGKKQYELERILENAK